MSVPKRPFCPLLGPADKNSALPLVEKTSTKTIVHNTAYSWIKKKQRMEQGLVPFDEEIHAAPLEIAPSEQYLERRRQLFEQALERLPAEFRESLVLYELEGWCYKAIATACDVPVGTVMSRLSRARCRS